MFATSFSCDRAVHAHGKSDPRREKRVDSNLIWMKVWLKKKHGFLVFSLEMQLAKSKKKKRLSILDIIIRKST